MSRPSNNDFRIAGAIGLVVDPTQSSTQETLLQGIGFPLRPIDNTLPTIFPEIANGVIAEGLSMQWMGNWQQGLYYPKGSFVRDGSWTLVATTLTLDKPSPIPDPDDPESYGLVSYTPATQSDVSVVVSGQTYTFSQDGWIKELLVWVTELTGTTNYRIIIANITDPENITTSVIEEPVLVAGEWKTIALLDQIIVAGTVLVISIDALNSGANTNISGGWRYAGPSQGIAPPGQGWTQDNQRTDFIIDKFDLDSQDRGTELEGVIPDATISVVQTDDVGRTATYRVRTVTDNGTFMTYETVMLTETGAGVEAGAVTTVDIAIPIALPTEYAEELLVWGTPPSWASSVTGFLSFNGVDQAVPTTNAYGVDILFQPAEVSENWDIVSFTG